MVFFCVSFGKILCRPRSSDFRNTLTQKLILCSYLQVVIQPGKKDLLIRLFSFRILRDRFQNLTCGPPNIFKLNFFLLSEDESAKLSLWLPKCQQDALMIVLCQYHSFSRGHLFSSSGYCHFPFQARRRRNTVFSSHTFGVRKSSRARPRLRHRNQSLFSSGWWRAGGEDLLETVASRPLFAF